MKFNACKLLVAAAALIAMATANPFLIDRGCLDCQGSCEENMEICMDGMPSVTSLTLVHEMLTHHAQRFAGLAGMQMIRVGILIALPNASRTAMRGSASAAAPA